MAPEVVRRLKQTDLRPSHKVEASCTDGRSGTCLKHPGEQHAAPAKMLRHAGESINVPGHRALIRVIPPTLEVA
jgi:hypothetical protein